MFQLKDAEWLNSYVSYLEYKKESKMEVAKRRQRKGKSLKERQQRKNLQTRVGTSDETEMPPSWLVIGSSPNLHCTGFGGRRRRGVLWEGGDKKYEKRKPRLLEASPLGSAHPHILGCPILCLLNKTLSCNWGVTLVLHFKSLLWQDRTEEIMHSPNIPKSKTHIYTVCKRPTSCVGTHTYWKWRDAK